MFPGFDVSDWDDNIVWLWRWSNLRTIDVYLSHIAGSKSTSWTRRWHDLKDQGWGLVPIWLPFAWNHVADMAAADGNDHGRTAVSRARQAQVEHGECRRPRARRFNRVVHGGGIDDVKAASGQGAAKARAERRVIVENQEARILRQFNLRVRHGGLIVEPAARTNQLRPNLRR